jgi:plasmid maintenance system antidote protein VapI
MSKSLFSYSDYRIFLRETLASRPGHGRGELQRMARFAKIHPSVLSLVFQEKRDLTEEQAVAIAEYFGLSEAETHFFLLLTQVARAGSERLRKLYRAQIDTIQKKQSQLAPRVRTSRELTEAEKAVFYASWFYSAIRVLSSIPKFSTRENLRKAVDLPPVLFRNVLAFLLANGLCREEGGKIAPGLHWTHLAADSPLVARHHANWRLKAMEKHPSLDTERELAFTCPMALSEKDALRIRGKLLDLIEEICKEASPSPSEAAFFLNVDWLRLSP